MVVMGEIRSNVNGAIRSIWPGARLEQVLPKANKGKATRAGLAVVMRQGVEMLAPSRWEYEGEGNKCLMQAVVTKINSNTEMIGIYLSPQTKGAILDETLDKIKRKEKRRTIIVGNLNERHCAWDNMNNERGRAVHRCGERN